jgi:tricarballylate dehydrogenase
MDRVDVIVMGGGNAALSAALAAAERGARVCMLERAPAEHRGGNSFVTAGAFRFPYRGIEDVAQIVSDPVLSVPDRIEIGQYTEEEFLADLQRITQGRADPELSQALVSRAVATLRWLREKGVEFVLAYDRQSFLVNGRHRFWGGLIIKARGEGAGLIDALYRAAQRARVVVQYGARATALEWEGAGRWWRVGAVVGARPRDYRARAVVLASGGFEANPEMRAAHLGPRWKGVKVRGTPYNTGDGIRMGLAAGGRPFGEWNGCHAVAWDVNAPASNEERLAQHFERDSYPLGIYVNLRGERFVDEGAEFRNYTYARYGQEIIRQPQQVAFQIFDQKVVPLLKRPYSLPRTTRVEARTIAELSHKAGIEVRSLERTVSEYNAAVNANVFNPAAKDGKAALSITPPKSNWAQRLDTPPYVCFPVTCGITFTFGGLKITPQAEVVDADERIVSGLFACGELVGGLFYHNYPGGSGLIAGAVFGRTAGEMAAKFAARLKGVP